MIIQEVIIHTRSFRKSFTHVEGGAGCVCTHTGIACVSLLFETVLKANSHILVEADCYGGTFRLLKSSKKNTTSLFTLQIF